MRRRPTLLIAILIGAFALFLYAAPTRAATLTVNTVTDDNAANGLCSLREAITAANTDAAFGGCAAGSGTDTITFDATVFATPQTINLTSALPNIASNMTIDGPATPDRITVRRDTGGDYGIFTIDSGVVTIDGLTLTDGNPSAPFSAGGIKNNGTLTVSNSAIIDNGATGGNTTGGIENNGTLTVINSIIIDNAASGGGAAGAIESSGTLIVINAVISGNTAGGGGSTGGILNDGTLIVTNSTIVGNEGVTAGGISNNSTATLNNSIIADSTGGDCVNFGTINARNSIIEGDLTCVNGTNIDNRTGDPNLNASFAPNVGSIAINAGSNALALDGDGNPLTTDLAGNPRVVGIVDAGAFELAYTPNFVVDDSDDTDGNVCSTAANDCTLRGAINLANAAAGTDTITFDATVFATNQIIQLTGALPDIASDMTIDGIATPDRITVRRDTGGDYRVFFVAMGVTATINGLTITNGSSTDDGGGVLNEGTLTMTDSVVSGNFVSGNGGGIFNQAALTMTNTIVNGNFATVGFGAGIFNSGTLTVTNSTISDNTAGNGGGGIYNAGTLTLINSTLSGNTATSGGGGGILNFNTLFVINSTLSGNTANVFGGGIRSQGTTTLYNSIIANSTSGGECVNGSGTINASHSIIEGDLTCVNGTNINNSTADPLLDLVTLIPTSAASPAVNAGSNALLPADPLDLDGDLDTSELLPVDARGIGFPRVVGSSVDIGAFEVVPPDFVVDRIDDANVGTCSSAANDCTLRGAINLANTAAGTDTITFDATVFATPQTITLESNLPDIFSNITIAGPGASSLTIDGGNTHQMFRTNLSTTFTLSGVTLTRASSVTGAAIRAGINGDATVNVDGVVFTNNTATDSGGAVVVVAGITTIQNSTFSGNTATIGFGGGIIVFLDGTLVLVNSTVTGGSANFGGGVWINGTATIINSTIAGNTATALGGGVRVFGGTLTLHNSIIADSTFGGECVRDGGMINASHSIIEDGLTCVNGTNVNNRTGDPNLNASFAPNVGSIAINAGSNALALDADGNPLTTDLAGNPRIVGTTVDIGAFESAFVGGTPGVTVVAFSVNPVQEGATTSYTIVLNAPPNPGETVTISARGYNGNFIALSPTSVQFTNANWNIPRTINIQVGDDGTDRGVRYNVAIDHAVTTNGASYVGVRVARIRLKILDNDLIAETAQDEAYYDALNLAAWLNVTSVTAPAGTSSLAATVSLNGQPMPGEVIVVNLASMAGVNVSPSQLVFTEHNWDVPQPITITALEAGTLPLQVVVDAGSTTALDFIGAAQAVTVNIIPAGSAVMPAEQPAPAFVPAPEAPDAGAEGTISE
jgi:CSLREA domain-containing protein